MNRPTSATEEFAPAKINLFLHVGERRADGYHALQSLIAFADIGDVLEFRPASNFSLAIQGPFAAALDEGDDNLVVRAARALAVKAHRDMGVAITLTKNLPVASGIGGGSADAAAALRGLMNLWKLDISHDELIALAATLGSDIPACVLSKTCWMEGRGEKLAPLAPLPQTAMLLVNPGIAVATSDVFRVLKERRGTGTATPSTPFRGADELLDFLRATSNDLQAPAAVVAPAITDVLNELARMPGVMISRMSGSGATCFALFEDVSSAELAATALSHSHPGWWVKATRIAS